MAELIIPQGDAITSWPEIRLALKRCVKAGAPLARVYSRWPLKYSVGDTVKLLQSKNDGGRIHAWMISVAKAEPFEQKMGGYALEWDLTLRIWGFAGYSFGTDDESTQNVIENEARLITSILYLNRHGLGMDNAYGLREVGLLTFDDIDVQGFSEGVDCHVAQGSMTIRTSEQFTF